MFASFLVGLSAGARSLTPLAVVTAAARRGALPPDTGAPASLACRGAIIAPPWADAAGRRSYASGDTARLAAGLLAEADGVIGRQTGRPSPPPAARR